jgi:hypothetical protein
MMGKDATIRRASCFLAAALLLTWVSAALAGPCNLLCYFGHWRNRCPGAKCATGVIGDCYGYFPNRWRAWPPECQPDALLPGCPVPGVPAPLSPPEAVPANSGAPEPAKPEAAPVPLPRILKEALPRQP